MREEEEKREGSMSHIFLDFLRSFSFSPASTFLPFSLHLCRSCSFPPASSRISRSSEAKYSLRPFAATECRRHYSDLPSSSTYFFLLLLLLLFRAHLSYLLPFPFFLLFFYFYNYSLLPLLFLLLLLLLISSVSTSQGPFSRRSLLLTGRVVCFLCLSESAWYRGYYWSLDISLPIFLPRLLFRSRTTFPPDAYPPKNG